MIRIKDITFENTALAPMAGVTDPAFRLLCKRFGAGLIYTEMVSAKAITYNNRNTFDLLEVNEEERPVALQLFGSEPSVMAKAVEMINDRNFDILDINMGCPVPKVVNNHEGSALMQHPDLIYEIVKAVCSATDKPVSVKMRKGFKKTDRTAVECALAAESAGASLIAVHGRTREDYYAGHADWTIIKEVKDAVKVPVLGNGDIFTPEDAGRMLEETGVDGVMIGRGAQGNPWIFDRVNEFLKTGHIKAEPTREQRITTALEHLRMEIEAYGEDRGVREMRKHIAWYMSGFPGASKIRENVNFATTYADVERILRR